jgi:inorganic phosphate transporter, PiT family
VILVLCVILAALIFEYINGFHDSANSIATVVSTKVLMPRQAVLLAAVCNLLGALWGTAVATTIGRGLLDAQFVTLNSILCALISAVIWGIFTWYFGLPSSSSHALIGGLCGSTLSAAHNNWSVIKWSVTNPETHKLEGLLPKVILPMVISPVLGIITGFILMGFLIYILRKANPRHVNVFFNKLQLLSASFMGISHGTNDAQKTMGIIALTLFTATNAHLFDSLPNWLSFLRNDVFEVHLWVKIVCALTMALGTAAGGYRIIRTLGHKMVKLQPIHGFAAETTAATLIQVASHFGIPLSTTHIISTSIMGVGATKRFSAVKWGIVQRMIWAWVLTLPITALMGYFFETVIHMTGLVTP